jgi:hypothetical protein
MIWPYQDPPAELTKRTIGDAGDPAVSQNQSPWCTFHKRESAELAKCYQSGPARPVREPTEGLRIRHLPAPPP